MDLVQDAVCMDNDIDDDDKPFNPEAYSKGKET
jgi:hypothetical protein